MDHLINRIVCADCMDILRSLPDKCVDLVLTDPPYGKGCEDGKICRAGGRFAKYGNEKFVAWDTPPPARSFCGDFPRIETANYMGRQLFFPTAHAML